MLIVAVLKKVHRRPLRRRKLRQRELRVVAAFLGGESLDPRPPVHRISLHDDGPNKRSPRSCSRCVRGVSLRCPAESKSRQLLNTVNTTDSLQHLERVYRAVVADGVLDVMYSASININGGYGRARRTTLHPLTLTSDAWT